MPRRPPGALRATPLTTREIRRALLRYRQVLRRPGRWVYLPQPDCPCCDVTYERDLLAEAIRTLPPRAAGALRRRVGEVDEELLRRSLPDPYADPGRPWWHRRLFAD
ncbi:hypothetical protein [Actinocatenispora rupis]|uniref:Uncharacterized protein n=1 Tax=Actinocatenispora rupis TaxID=519421 RepID=A0A8J3JCA0_9ACTN|nr:hypothetical protein [Actinocatenispora rupis]GID12183.1 hypothetical protein Aru02nite_30720 [Actinocatenispora rupis]